jgi:hypothetical protein
LDGDVELKLLEINEDGLLRVALTLLRLTRTIKAKKRTMDEVFIHNTTDLDEQIKCFAFLLLPFSGHFCSSFHPRPTSYNTFK